VRGGQIGGDSVEDPRQSDAGSFATLLQGDGVTMYVVVPECRRQGGSVSFSFTPGLYALCGMIGLDMTLSVLRKSMAKIKAQRRFHL